jgi:hypothetical protein
MFVKVFSVLLSISVVNTGAPASTETINLNSESHQVAYSEERIVDYNSSFDYYINYSIPAQKEIERKREEERKERERLERERLERERIERERQQALKRSLAKRATYKRTPTPAQVNGDFEGQIRANCAIHGCNSTQVIRVMYCESGGRSNARNASGASGLFQFMPRTFYANAKRVGLQGANIWNPTHQIQIATWMFANGQAWQWVCK